MVPKWYSLVPFIFRREMLYVLYLAPKKTKICKILSKIQKKTKNFAKTQHFVEK